MFFSDLGIKVYFSFRNLELIFSCTFLKLFGNPELLVFFSFSTTVSNVTGIRVKFKCQREKINLINSVYFSH